MKVLVLGAGKRPTRNVRRLIDSVDFSGDDLTTIDMDPSANPTILMDISGVPGGEKLPFEDGTFDQIHAYDVLEHIGRLGDWRGFFTEFGEYHRILKGDGLIYILVPSGKDTFTDPGHSRVFSVSHFYFLDQRFYAQEQRNHTTCTDYRWFWKKSFEVVVAQDEDHHIAVVLRKA